jgi:hypothetical protein
MARKKPVISPFGQWAYPGEVTIIPSSDITMKGVNYPVLGIDNLGNQQMMMPGGEYKFPGDYVTEIPQMGKGGLRQWFAEEWTDVKTGKPCGRSGKDKDGRPYPACRPKKRVNETTPKTTSEMSSAEKAKFKREKTSGKRIDYNHKRREFGGESWLDEYQVGGRAPIYTSDLNDPRLKAYSDSLYNYNLTKKYPKENFYFYKQDYVNSTYTKPKSAGDIMYPRNIRGNMKPIRWDNYVTGEGFDNYFPEYSVARYKKPVQRVIYKKPEIIPEVVETPVAPVPVIEPPKPSLAISNIDRDMYTPGGGMGREYNIGVTLQDGSKKAFRTEKEYQDWKEANNLDISNAKVTEGKGYSYDYPENKKYGGWLSKYQDGGWFSNFIVNNPQLATNLFASANVVKKSAEKIGDASKQQMFDRYRPVDYPDPIGAITGMGKDVPLRDLQGDYHVSEEAWRLALGLPTKSKYITPSKYKPSKANDPNAQYYSLNNVYDPQKLIDAYIQKSKGKPGQTVQMDSLFPYVVNQDTVATDNNIQFDQTDPLQKFSLSQGEDEKGRYISIYDKYDFNVPLMDNVVYGSNRKPYEFYDRFYYKKDATGKPVYVKQKKNGGWLNQYQDGGENLPELNSKIDIANFYKNRLSDKYGIYQDPTDNAYKYYLKSKGVPAMEQSVDVSNIDKQKLKEINTKKASLSEIQLSNIKPVSSVILPKQREEILRDKLYYEQDDLMEELSNEIPIIPPSYKEVLQSIPKIEESKTKTLPNKQKPLKAELNKNIELNPVQQFYADRMYKKYGKVILTDKANNRTIYGVKKPDGTWDLNSFEVLTGQATNFNEISGLSVDDLEKFRNKRGTPIGVFPLTSDDNIYGYPGLRLDGSGNIAYHITYKGPDDLYRSALYNNNNLQDNYRSYGCINCEKPSLEKLLKFAKPNDKALIINSNLGFKNNENWIKKNTPNLYNDLFKKEGGQTSWLNKYK